MTGGYLDAMDVAVYPSLLEAGDLTAGTIKAPADGGVIEISSWLMAPKSTSRDEIGRRSRASPSIRLPLLAAEDK